MIEATDVERMVLAPGGVLRAALNFSNPVIAVRDAAGCPGGVSALLARRIAECLGARLEIVSFESPVDAFAAAKADEVGIAFLAVDPNRAKSVAFAPAYVQIEGTYVVSAGSPYMRCADIDHVGVHIAVNRGAGYDSYLQQNLQQASIVHVDALKEAVALVADGRAEAGAGIRPALDRAALAYKGLRTLSDCFMTVGHSICVPNTRRTVVPLLTRIVAEALRDGAIVAALKESGNDPAVAVRDYPAIST